MAVDPDDVDAITAQVAAIYADAEHALLDMVARSLAQGIDGPTWAEERLAGVRALRRAASQILTGLQAGSNKAIREAVAAAYRLGTGAALTDLPEKWIPRSGVGQAARAASVTVTQLGPVESLATALIRDLADVTASVLRGVVDVYRGVIASATGRILAAGRTRRQAAQEAWQGLVDRGIAGFTDSGGRRWRLSSYVEMATRTVTARAAVQGQTERLATLGIDLVYVSNSPQECALCRPFEGEILARGDGPTGHVQVESALHDGQMVSIHVLTTLDAARIAGLFHPNCRHSISAYLPGVTRIPSGPTADPEGERARERQREIERHLRRWKERRDSALEPEAAKLAAKKVRGWQAAMREHLAEHPDLKRLSYREQPGAGNTPRGRQVTPAAPLGPDVQSEI